MHTNNNDHKGFTLCSNLTLEIVKYLIYVNMYLECTKRLKYISLFQIIIIIMMSESALTKTQEFFKGKSIFITGASGFMGKVLLEKLLFSCSDVKQIIILMRPKRGKSALQRVQDFISLPVSVFN